MGLDYRRVRGADFNSMKGKKTFLHSKLLKGNGMFDEAVSSKTFKVLELINQFSGCYKGIYALEKIWVAFEVSFSLKII